MANKDYYNILGISKSANDKDIKQAFRKLARKFHPDVNPGDKTAEAKFKEINEAFEVLSDAEKRKKYDLYGDQWQYAEQFARSNRQNTGWNTGQAEEAYGFTEDDDIFSSLFRGFRTHSYRENRPSRGRDIEYPVEVNLEDAYSGTGRLLTMQNEEICPGCKGTGRVHNLPCSVCRGTGKVYREKRLEVKIPPGVTNGSRVRFAGQGNPGLRGGTNGDLFLLISIRPHPVFERRGDDLNISVDIPLLVAILGGETQVPTLKGYVMLKIPPETQNGKVFNLNGQGMPHLGTSKYGNLLVKVNIMIPTGLTSQERELFKQLAKLHEDQGNK